MCRQCLVKSLKSEKWLKDSIRCLVQFQFLNSPSWYAHSRTIWEKGSCNTTWLRCCDLFPQAQHAFIAVKIWTANRTEFWNGYLTIVLCEQSSSFQIKLFFADLLLKPQLQISPVSVPGINNALSIRDFAFQNYPFLPSIPRMGLSVYHVDS